MFVVVTGHDINVNNNDDDYFRTSVKELQFYCARLDFKHMQNENSRLCIR